MLYFTMTSEEVLAKLQAMMADPDMITNDKYSPNSELYPDNRISFIDQHVAYLKAHKQVDPAQYLSNLALMITRR